MPTVFEQIFGNGQGGAQGLLGNPAFMVGSGLLSNQGNPWGGALQGLAAAQGYKLSEARMKKDEEKEARLKELQDMQMRAAKQAEGRQQYTQALLAAGSSQNPGLLQDPTFQAQLRQKAAAYGDPAALEQGGLLAPLPTSTELPADARLFEWAKGNPERMAFVQRSNQAQVPANIQEWQQYQGMTPEQQAAYLNMKRSGYGYDVGGVPQYRGAGGDVTPLATPEQVAANRGQQSAAQAAGTETGKADALAVIDLPKIESSSAYMGNLLDELKAHPGKSYAVGASSIAPIIPGTPAAGFMSRLSQIKGGQFLKAYEQLKGAGTITEIEGLKAEQAIARMERAQSEPDFDAAVDDFKGVIMRAAESARARAKGVTSIVPGSSQAQGGKPARLVYDPVTGTVK